MYSVNEMTTIKQKVILSAILYRILRQHGKLDYYDAAVNLYVP